MKDIIKYCTIAFAFLLIFTILFFTLYGMKFLSYFLKKETQMLEEFKYIDVSEGVKSLHIDVVSANITIKDGNVFQVKTNNPYIKSTVKQNELVLTEKKQYWYNNQSELIIIIPRTQTLEQFSLENAAGMIDIEYLSTQELELELGAGRVNIQDIKVFKKTEIDSGAGEFTIQNGNLYHLDFDQGVGKVSLTAEIMGNSKVNCGVGELHLTLIGEEENYKITTDKGIGSIKINGKNIQSGSTYGIGENRLDIAGGVGSISISFK